MDLSPVSKTSILISICRAIGADNAKYNFTDSQAHDVLSKLYNNASIDDQKWIDRIIKIYKGFQSRDTKMILRRVKAFDNEANIYIQNNPNCTVINLACGIDTRFWRIDNTLCNYIDLDLPEVIELKKSIFSNSLPYRTIGKSILDYSWIDEVTNKGNRNFLLIAEGLLYYLYEKQAVELIKQIGSRFQQSQIIMDVASIKYTKGIWKTIIKIEGHITLGLDLSLNYGVHNINEIEKFSNSYKILRSTKGNIGPVITVSIK
jgi:O-methyltransferase involved in polyketide biosynthesis